MGIKRNIHENKIVVKTVLVQEMENVHKEVFFNSVFDEADVEMYSELYSAQHTSVVNDDLWKKFDLPTPPLSPDHDNSDSLDFENLSMAFDIDTEDLVMLECSDTYKEMLRDIESIACISKPPLVIDPGLETCLESNLIQDIMWSAPSKLDVKDSKVPAKDKLRLRCDSCSNPTNPDCVAPDEVLMESNIAGSLSQTKVHNLGGLDTPSDSEEEIDVVTVEKQQQQQVIIAGKRKYRSDDESRPESYHRGSKTVTLKIEHKPTNSVHNITKCSSVRQRVECPTDVHNYSLPVTSLKRVHSYPNSPVTHKSKKLKKDISIPSDLRKVAQKLKSSVGSYCRNSSDSEDFNDVGKRTQHNVLERKRRTDLKHSFFNLRDSVPELEGQERAPKVIILKKAAQYIHKLIDEQRRQEREMEQLQLRREKLKRHLHKLRNY